MQLLDYTTQILETIPSEQERWVVENLRNNMCRNSDPSQSPAFYVVQFDNRLRTNGCPKLILTLDGELALNEVLLDFLDVYYGIGIKNIKLARECDIDSEEFCDWYMRGLEGIPSADRELERMERFYFENDGTTIVNYEERDKVYYHANSNGKIITIYSTQERIGMLTPTVVLEAYLLHILNRQENFTTPLLNLF